MAVPVMLLLILTEALLASGVRLVKRRSSDTNVNEVASTAQQKRSDSGTHAHEVGVPKVKNTIRSAAHGVHASVVGSNSSKDTTPSAVHGVNASVTALGTSVNEVASTAQQKRSGLGTHAHGLASVAEVNDTIRSAAHGVHASVVGSTSSKHRTPSTAHGVNASVVALNTSKEPAPQKLVAQEPAQAAHESPVSAEKGMLPKLVARMSAVVAEVNAAEVHAVFGAEIASLPQDSTRQEPVSEDLDVDKAGGFQRWHGALVKGGVFLVLAWTCYACAQTEAAASSAGASSSAAPAHATAAELADLLRAAHKKGQAKQAANLMTSRIGSSLAAPPRMKGKVLLKESVRAAIDEVLPA